MKRLLAIMLLIGMLCITGCSKDADIEGKWFMQGFFIDGLDAATEESLGLDEMNELYSSGLITQTHTYKDGKFSLVTSGLGESSEIKGTYELDGDKLTVTTDDNEYYIVSLDGDELILMIADENWETSGAYMKYRRAE